MRIAPDRFPAEKQIELFFAVYDADIFGNRSIAGHPAAIEADFQLLRHFQMTDSAMDRFRSIK